MRCRSGLLAMFVIAALPLVGCTQTREPDATRADAEAPGVADTESIIGELKSVDPEARTFGVSTDDGRDRTFSYSDATDIAGTSGVQGLTGRKGARVKVHYREEPATSLSPAALTAVKIEMIETR
jgi:hypothetical protein